MIGIPLGIKIMEQGQENRSLIHSDSSEMITSNEISHAEKLQDLRIQFTNIEKAYDVLFKYNYFASLKFTGYTFPSSKVLSALSLVLCVAIAIFLSTIISPAGSIACAAAIFSLSHTLIKLREQHLIKKVCLQELDWQPQDGRLEQQLCKTIQTYAQSYQNLCSKEEALITSKLIADTKSTRLRTVNFLAITDAIESINNSVEEKIIQLYPTIGKKPSGKIPSLDTAFSRIGYSKGFDLMNGEKVNHKRFKTDIEQIAEENETEMEAVKKSPEKLESRAPSSDSPSSSFNPSEK